MTQSAGGGSLAREQPVLEVRTVFRAKEFESVLCRIDDSRLRIDDQEPRVASATRRELSGVEDSVDRVGRHSRAGF
jgi:hypothetical protein